MNRAWIVWVGMAAALTGCVGSQTEKVEGRSQIGEDPADPDAFATVGAKTTPANTEPHGANPRDRHSSGGTVRRCCL